MGWITRFSAVVLHVGISALPAPPGAATAGARLAVLPVGDAPDTLLATHWLQTAAEACEGCTTVEREQIETVLRERELKSGAEREYASGLHQTVPADGFLFAEAMQVGDQRTVRLAAVEARSGALLLARLLPTASDEELRPKVKEFVAQALSQLQQVRMGGKYIAFPRVEPGVTGGDWQGVANALTALVEAGLSDLEGVAVLDRSRLRRVGEESTISGLDQDLLRSVVLVEVGFRPTDTHGAIELALRATWPGRGMLTPVTVQGHRRALGTAAGAVVRRTSELLAIPAPSEDALDKAGDEVLWLKNRVAVLLRWKSYGAALEAAEALHALTPTSQESRALLIRAIREAKPDDLEMLRRAAELRACYWEDFSDVPTAKLDRLPFSMDRYQFQPASADDSQARRAQWKALEAAEERLFHVECETGERYWKKYEYPFIAIQALRTRIEQLETWRPDDPAVQLALLPKGAALFERSLSLDRQPSESAAELLLSTVSPLLCDLVVRKPALAPLYRDYLAALSTASNGWLRMAANRGAYTLLCLRKPDLVPDALRNARQLARASARIVAHELLPHLVEDRPTPRLKYPDPRTFQSHNELLERFLLLAPHQFIRLQGYGEIQEPLPRLTSDTERLDDLATTLATVVNLDWRRHPFRLPVAESRILDALAETGQEDRVRRIRGLPPSSPPAPSQPVAPPSASIPDAWSAFRVARIGPGYLRRRGRLSRTVEGVTFARDEHWMFLLPDGNSVRIIDVQGWQPKGTPLVLRIVHMQLPEGGILDDRRVPLDCDVPDYGTDVVNGAAYGDGTYFVATTRGLLTVDAHSFERTWLTAREGLPCDVVSAVGWHDGALYLATDRNLQSTASSLLRYAPDTGRIEEVAAQRSLAARTVWDGKLFEVTDMLSDTPRKRLLIRVKGLRNYTMDIWSLSPESLQLDPVRAVRSERETLWLPTSRHNGNSAGVPHVFLPASGDTLALPGSTDSVRVACDGDTVFFVEAWGDKEAPRAIHLVQKGMPSVRRTCTDDGAPLSHLVGLCGTDAGVVLVDAFGGTFLISRR